MNALQVREFWSIYFDDDFELSDGCDSDEDCSEGPSYLGNDELQLEELDALAREVTSADMASRWRQQ